MPGLTTSLKASPWLAPWRPPVGITPTLSDAELITLAVMSALLGYTSERRWLRRVGRDFGQLFPYVPQQSGYNKRLRAAFSLLTSMIRIVARDTSLWSDDVWTRNRGRLLEGGVHGGGALLPVSYATPAARACGWLRQRRSHDALTPSGGAAWPRRWGAVPMVGPLVGRRGSTNAARAAQAVAAGLVSLRWPLRGREICG